MQYQGVPWQFTGGGGLLWQWPVYRQQDLQVQSRLGRKGLCNQVLQYDVSQRGVCGREAAVQGWLDWQEL